MLAAQSFKRRKQGFAGRLFLFAEVHEMEEGAVGGEAHGVGGGGVGEGGTRLVEKLIGIALAASCAAGKEAAQKQVTAQARHVAFGGYPFKGLG